MRRRVLTGAIALCAAAGLVRADDLDTLLARFQATRHEAPADVAAYMERYMVCWHMAGEAGYNAARKAEINRTITEYRCTSLQADQAALRRTHAGTPAALAALDAAAALR